MFDAGTVMAAIAGGSLQMGMGDLISGVNAIIAGIPIVLIAGGALYRMGLDEGLGAVAVARSSSIIDAKGLVGATIGVPTLVGETTVFVRSYGSPKRVYRSRKFASSKFRRRRSWPPSSAERSTRASPARRSRPSRRRSFAPSATRTTCWPARAGSRVLQLGLVCVETVDRR